MKIFGGFTVSLLTSDQEANIFYRKKKTYTIYSYGGRCLLIFPDAANLCCVLE